MIYDFIKVGLGGKKSYLLSFFFCLSSTFAWTQINLDSSFAQAENQRANARVSEALRLLEQVKSVAQAEERLPEWQVQVAKCLSDIDSLSPARQLLQTAKAQLKLPEQDLLLAEALNLEGSIALQQNNWLEAEQYYREALSFREAYLGARNEKVADSHNNLGAVYYLQQDYDQALFHHQQALTIRQETLESPHPDLGSSYNNLAACYYDLGQIETAIQYNQKALEQRLGSFAERHPSVADSYNNLGNCYFDLYLLEQAIDQHQKALAIREDLNLLAAQAASRNNLGNCWLEGGDFERAIQSFSQAIDLYQKTYGANHPVIAEVVINQGNAYQEIGDFPNALRRFQLAQLLMEDLFGLKAPNRIPALLGQATVLQGLGDYKSAIPLFQEVIQQVKTQLGADHPLLPEAYNNLGNCFFRQDEFLQARRYYQSALSAFSRQKGWITERASSLFNIGNTHQEQQNPDLALSFYKQALAVLADKYSLSDLYFKIQSARASAYAKTGKPSLARNVLEEQVEKLDRQSSAPRLSWIDLYRQLADLYQQERTTASLEKALSNYQKATDLLDRLVIYQRSRLAKQNIRLDYFSLYENGIRIALQLAKTKNDPTQLEAAFALSEKSKALLIREASNESDAQRFAHLPDSLILQEARLKRKISEYEQIRYEQAGQLDSLSLRELEIELLKLRGSYNKLIAYLEKQFPAYFQMKYRSVAPSAEQVRAQLNTEQALLSYFVGDNTIFVFVISRSGLEAVQLAHQDLETQTIQLWDAISHFTGAQMADDYRLYAQQYASNGYQLYQQLLAPIEEKIDLPTGLTIIPDGILCYLPFDLLLAQAVDDSHLFRFDQHPYLIHQYRFSYAYSVDQWSKAQLDNELGRAVRWTGFAPAFYQGKSSFEPLYHNETEVRNIARILSGNQVFTGREASISTLEEQVDRPGIIHLATHGLANASRSDFAFLAFTAKDSTEQLLYTQNLYAMDMRQVALVVLSACETGLGEALPGEGVMSLAHAFRYAGAKSIITTLWSIDDEKTTKIMLYFYQQLKLGKDKDEALRQARLQYLSAHNGEYAHPFYWAAFVPIGDMEAVTFVKKVDYLMTAGALVLSFIVFLLWTYRRRKPSGPRTFS
ncbi:MAG TPA: CHAT domain-containing tetratricopeptide repeat protein [Saprospiraceae bacterium]|nr:CHAT domain-containing tetratricopeptide repeat protein [Saprospiraceae bacterium]